MEGRSGGMEAGGGRPIPGGVSGGRRKEEATAGAGTHPRTLRTDTVAPPKPRPSVVPTPPAWVTSPRPVDRLLLPWAMATFPRPLPACLGPLIMRMAAPLPSRPAGCRATQYPSQPHPTSASSPPVQRRDNPAPLTPMEQSRLECRPRPPPPSERPNQSDRFYCRAPCSP